MRHRRLLQSVLLLVGYLSTLHALTVRQYHCQHHHLWASSSSSSTRTASRQTATTSDASYNTPTRFGRHHVLFAVPVVATASFLWQSSSLSMSWQSSDEYNDNDDDTHNGNSSPPDVLHRLLQSEMDGSRTSLSPILLPCCYDGLTARLVARYRSSTTGSDDQGTHGIQSGLGCFDATFLTGFGASAVYGYPDTQLVSYDEMLATCRTVSAALASVALEQATINRVKQPRRLRRRPPIPCIADGDTGYGNAVNVKRTVLGYGRAGMAGIMIEDQVAPKRCGHVLGKSIVPLNEAVQRIRAACDARDEYAALYGSGGSTGTMRGPLILARTDARQCDGFEAAIERCLAFVEAGADMTFLEAPQSIDEMVDYCRRVPGPKLANMLEQGRTPIVSPVQLKQMGYTMAAYPLTLLSASILAMQTSLQRIYDGTPTDDIICSFDQTKDVVGFTQYAMEQDRYRVD